jgi:hypothetical protein
MIYTQIIKYLSFICVIFLVSCSQEKREFDWLVGDWQRINDTDRQRTFEYWFHDEDGSLKGKGFTLEGKDSVFIENLAMKKIDQKWQLIVTGVHEDPTFFEVTSFTDKKFICENPTIDFPKKLEYSLKNDTLTALVSNEEFTIDFVFIRK